MAAVALFKAFPGTGKPRAPLVEFIKGSVFYTVSSAEPASQDGIVFFCIDSKLIYYSFYLDFGPHNLGSTFQFCTVMNKMLAAAIAKRKQIHFYSSPDPRLRANAVCLLAAWGVLFHGMAPHQAFAPFAFMSFPSFHDASPVESEFKLTILGCLEGLSKALHYQYIHPSTFDLVEYHHYEQVENGDLTWVTPKFIAFAGPQSEYSLSSDGYVTLTPEHYVPYFRKKGVTLVVRLNEAAYDANRFTTAGIAHADLYYPDGANPPEHILQQFLDLCEKTPGAVAVHCKAGLGRTGTCIAAYMMKHHRFRAKEAIGWLRLCRPGSVIGPQQEYLESIERKMWQQGDALTKANQRSAYMETLSDVSLSSIAPTSPVSPRSPGRGRLLATRAINIFEVRRSVDLSASGGVASIVGLVDSTATYKAVSGKKPGVTQGDQLRSRKQQHTQGYCVR